MINKKCLLYLCAVVGFTSYLNAGEAPIDKFNDMLQIAKLRPTAENLEKALTVAMFLPDDVNGTIDSDYRKIEALLLVLQLVKKQQVPILPGERGRGNFTIPEVDEGTTPAEIEDPVLRKKFEVAIAENNRLIQRSNYQGRISKLIKLNQFYIEKVLERSITGDEKKRIIKRTEEIIGAENLNVLRPGENAKK